MVKEGKTLESDEENLAELTRNIRHFLFLLICNQILRKLFGQIIWQHHEPAHQPVQTQDVFFFGFE
jgi:hypothetical protein